MPPSVVKRRLTYEHASFLKLLDLSQRGRRRHCSSDTSTMYSDLPALRFTRIEVQKNIPHCLAEEILAKVGIS
jgi:hypothetical protein